MLIVIIFVHFECEEFQSIFDFVISTMLSAMYSLAADPILPQHTFPSSTKWHTVDFAPSPRFPASL